MLSKLILLTVGCVSEGKMLVRRFSVWGDLNNLVSVSGMCHFFFTRRSRYFRLSQPKILLHDVQLL